MNNNYNGDGDDKKELLTLTAFCCDPDSEKSYTQG